jgi:hypothetical protein
MFIDQGITEI